MTAAREPALRGQGSPFRSFLNDKWFRRVGVMAWVVEGKEYAAQPAEEVEIVDYH